MSLANRLKSAQVKVSNQGCQSCKWWETQTPETKSLINAWLDAGNSSMQLHDILSSNPDGSVDPAELLTVSYSAWQNHVKHHDEMCREPK
jgi:hypothetical protein